MLKLPLSQPSRNDVGKGPGVPPPFKVGDWSHRQTVSGEYQTTLVCRGVCAGTTPGDFTEDKVRCGPLPFAIL